MCGIAGFWQQGRASVDYAEGMADAITSRGPDDSGTWVDETTGLALAHRRLSVLELSFAGHQPMVSPCGRYVIVYNGEIYNHGELRSQLAREGGSFEWRGGSDTETLLASLRHWGLQAALERINGMFAFALWDSSERTLFLARDRMGEKPLYYGRCGNTFMFGSELKALAAHPDWEAAVDRDALALYMRFKYVPTPWSIFRGINKLPPASFVSIRNDGKDIGEPQCYWSLRGVAEEGLRSAGGEPVELLEELVGLLSDSVRRRMAADVPLGAFLSGGYDSTAVAALMQANSGSPVNTFSIGFREEGYNEAAYARDVARYLGTNHTEHYVTPQDAMEVIPKLPGIYDEPFAGSSQIPAFLVSQLAREHVTVALSGDGGDELFGGYNRHVVGPDIWKRVKAIPHPVRRLLGSGIGRIAAGDEWINRYLRAGSGVPKLGVKLEKLASALGAGSGRDFYRDLVSLWKDPEQVVPGANEPDTILDDPGQWPESGDLREQMLFWDMATYLPDELLTKVDRASMAVGLEARVPLLDHRVVEFAWRVPTEYKVRDGQGKWLLRELVHRHVPREMMDRPKMGFGVPIEQWLRGPLREWAESLLDERKLHAQGFFDPVPIRKAWNDHLHGRGRNQYALWAVLMFQAWWEERDNHA